MSRWQRGREGTGERSAPAERLVPLCAVLTCVMALIALLYAANAGRLIGSFQGFYDEHNRWRQILLETRLRAYTWMLAAMALAAAIWTLSLRLRNLLELLFNASARILGRYGRAALMAMLGAGVVLAGLWFSQVEWVRFGRPCYDNYCVYAVLVHRWLFEGAAGSGELLLHFMRTEGHGNSPMGPLIISIVMRLTGLGVIGAYRLSCGLATAGTLAIVGISLFRRVKTGQEARFAALVLLATNLVLVRSAVFPQTDAFVLFWTTAVLACALARLESGRPGWTALCWLLIATGLFVKLSFLPVLALVPAWYLMDTLAGPEDPHERRAPDLRRVSRGLVMHVLIFSVLPLAPYLLFQSLFEIHGEFLRELGGMSTIDSYLPFVVTSVLHAGLVFGVLIGVGWRKLGRLDSLLLGWTLLYLLSLWLSRASGWDRFYLAILPPLAVVGGRGLMRLRDRLSPAVMWVFVILAALLNYTALSLGLYY